MRFDINSIIDVHTYPREYFCPVCGTLMDPNEAFKSRCSHLFCKSCLAYIANGSKVCPYDGWLVTQSDSKPLIDLDKVLFENISKVRLRCLYFTSGCKWEGTLADCRCHCASCSFGNSLVTCSRCGIQVLHREAHDHAWNCPAMLGAQGSAGVPSVSTMSGTTLSTATAAVSQAATQSGASLPGVQNPPTTSSLVLAQNHMPFTANSQAPVVALVTMLDPYQWYQPQYLQYYQPPYMGYGPYQQPCQRCYHPHQQPLQQYRQHLVQMYEQHSHVYNHAVPPLQLQMQLPMLPHPQCQHPQSQPQPLPISQSPQHLLPSQPPLEPCFQPPAEGQVQQQMQHQLLPQLRPQAQAPAQMQGQGSLPTQVFTSNLANPQPPHMLHQLLPQLQPQAQAPLQMQGHPQSIVGPAEGKAPGSDSIPSQNSEPQSNPPCLAATTRTDPHGLMGGPFPLHIGDHVVYLRPGPFPGHGHTCAMGNVPGLHFTESNGDERQSFAHSGVLTTQILPGFMNAGSSAGGMDSADSRKRKSFGLGWCHICEVDCDSIEGLQLHSQSNEHQKLAMDKVKTFSLKDKKLQGTGDDA